MTLSKQTKVENGLTPAEARHLASLERKIDKGLQTFREVGMALLEIRDKRLYRQTHSTFELYSIDRWGLERGRAYQLIGAAEVVQSLGKAGDIITTETQARELVPMLKDDPGAVREVVQRVRDTGQPVTASLIREAVRTIHEPVGTPIRVGPTPTERLMTDFVRLTNSYRAWVESKPSRKDKAAVQGAIDAFNELVKGD